MDFPLFNSKKERIQSLEEEIERLEHEIEELQEERDSYMRRFESEKERRSKLSTEKQEAQKELKKLRQKIEADEQEKAEEPVETGKSSFKNLKIEEAKEVISKLSTVESDTDDMVTVYSEEKISEIDDFRGLKNTLNSDQISSIDYSSPYIAFLDDNLFRTVLRTRPFFRSEWILSDSFRIERLSGFIEEEKTWVVVSAGESKVIEEQDGEIIQTEKVKNRVDHKHTQGGYSQKRFERKREEQIEEHLDKLREKIPEEDFYILGEKRLCRKLEGKYLGGFDDNRKPVDALYGFQINSEHG